MEGWKEVALIDLAQYINGFAFKPADWNTDGLPIIRIEQLKNPKSVSDFCSFSIPEYNIINNGDLIFSWSGTLMIDFWVGGKGGLNQHLFKVTSKKFKKWFYYLATKFHLDEFIRIADGNKTSLGHIKREHLENAIVFIPEENQLIYFDGSMKILIENLINIKKETKKRIS